MALKKNNKVEKRNDLNEIRANSMTMQELRFFAIYLSKINARDESTRVVRFPLADFQKIMGLGRLNVKSIKAATDKLLGHVVHVPLESGGFRSFQLFKECVVEKDALEEWYVEIDAHDKALPLFFDFKEKYFTYEVGNVLRLGSFNQMRMYEILKQRERQQQPVKIMLPELRQLLGVPADAYPRFGDFKTWVLEKAQAGLSLQTDISFSYETIKKGPKVIAIAFTIEKNTVEFPQLCLEEYINSLPDVDTTGGAAGDPEDAAEDDAADSLPPSDLYAEALPRCLSAAEVEALRALAVDHVDTTGGIADAELKIYDYLNEKARLLYASKKAVPEGNYFAWLRKAVTEDWK